MSGALGIDMTPDEVSTETHEEYEQRIAEEIAAATGSIFTPRVIRKCRALLAARDDYAEKDAAAKAAKKEMDDLELDVFELFEGLQGSLGGKKAGSTVSVPLGEPYGVCKFRTRETHYGKIVDEDAFLDWVEDRAMLDEFSTPKITKGRLHEEVRKRKEAGGDMPPGVSYYTDRGMTVTRPK